MRKNKKKIITVAIILCLALSEAVGILPYVAARAASRIYVTINHSSSKLKFVDAEYAYGFGNYSVSYRDKEGKLQSFMMFPKVFPVFVVFDSIKGEG
ncbi:hypothetical protein JK636_14575 [Clostridium sp. YIM B02515]|uniref:Uncharacterized protein n=1 Tax=Clostridium rhizosphaerae TaxID=2803861 RepID=A0ABS1TC93_9CLOT|nr:hypothetical protein [Clostridium rhizosphaerae]MBL4936976.1 hypothetical protein [Clostridium rhizosphaerae]